MWENFWRDYSWKFPQHGKGNSSPRGTKSPIQDKPKEKHAKTHTNQTNRLNTKKKILKLTREKPQATYKENPVRLTADLSVETLQARRECQDIFKVLKGENIQPRLVYLARILLKIYVEIKKVFR